MLKVTVSLSPDDTIRRAAEIMAERKVHRMVVLDAAGRLVGIVSPLDVLGAVRDGRLRLEG